MDNRELYNLVSSCLQEVDCHVHYCLTGGCYIMSDAGFIHADLLFRCVDLARAYDLCCYVSRCQDSLKIVFYTS